MGARTSAGRVRGEAYPRDVPAAGAALELLLSIALSSGRLERIVRRREGKSIMDVSTDLGIDLEVLMDQAESAVEGEGGFLR